MTTTRQLIEHHSGPVLMLSCALGLVIPGLPDIPNVAAIITLAALMFLSCYRLRDGGFKALRITDILGFYTLRYVLLPPLLFYAASWLLPHYATSILLLSLVPAAVSSPAFSAIYGGQTALAFAIVIFSQLAAPLLIPAQFALLGGQGSGPDPSSLLITLLWCILLPIGIYLFTRKNQPSAQYFYDRGKFFSILLIAFIIALAVAKQRSVILGSLNTLPITLAVSLGCYITYMLVGWFFLPTRPREQRISYSTCSAFNNAALAVSLALMHFSGEVLLFVAVSEIGWALLPMILKSFFRFR